MFAYSVPGGSFSSKCRFSGNIVHELEHDLHQSRTPTQLHMNPHIDTADSFTWACQFMFATGSFINL